MKRKAWTGKSSGFIYRTMLMPLLRYWAFKNAWSMDGLPGMKRGLVAAKRESVAPIKKMVGPFAPVKYHSPFGFSLEVLILAVLLAFAVGVLVASRGPALLERIQPSVAVPQPSMMIWNASPWK